jgi:RNA polymerase sigma-70 factor (ECF subfamily)
MERMNPSVSVDELASDAALAAQGDVAAYERLYRATVARVHTLARRFLGETDADDATQEAFVLAWRRLATFRGESEFSTWLHRLAINCFVSRARRREPEEKSGPVIGERASRPLDRDAALDLEAAIARLPGGARRVFVLYDVEGHRHEEIASLLGVSVGTSKSQLHRARLLLRDALTRGDRT